MATKVKKSEEIREILKANPTAKAKEVVMALGERGIKVNSAQVYAIIGALKNGKTSADTTVSNAVAVAADGDPLATILKVKTCAAEVGGLKKLKELVEALSE